MGFQRTVPGTPAQLLEYLTQLHENAGHVKSIQVNMNNNHLEVDLDWMANTKYPDVFIPLKRDKVDAAKRLVASILTASRSGFVPSPADSEALFAMIDPKGS